MERKNREKNGKRQKIIIHTSNNISDGSWSSSSSSQTRGNTISVKSSWKICVLNEDSYWLKRL